MRKASAGRRYRPATLIAAALVLVAGGALAFAMGSGGRAPKALSRSAAAPSAAAAAWVAAQVSRTATVACDPAMCRALEAHGVPGHDLVVLSSNTPGPLRSVVVVATGTVRKEWGGVLNSAYAPAVIATFGSGTSRIDVRVVAPHGAAAYWSELAQDLGQRKAIGTGLIGSTFSTRITVSSATAKRQLAAGLVDGRLLTTIENLASGHPIRVLAFGDSGPGASPGMPLRCAYISAASGAGSAELPSLLAVVRTQGPPNVPAHIQITRLSGQPALFVEFTAPSPLLVLNSST